MAIFTSSIDTLAAVLYHAQIFNPKRWNTVVSQSDFNQLLRTVDRLFEELDSRNRLSIRLNLVTKTFEMAEALTHAVSLWLEIDATIEISDRTIKPNAVQLDAIACVVNRGFPFLRRRAATTFNSLTLLVNQNIFF